MTLELAALDDIITELSGPKFGCWADWTELDFKKYYDSRFSGLSRVEVEKGGIPGGRAFYLAVLKCGLVDAVFPAPKLVRWRTFSKKDFQIHYATYFLGKSRSEVRNDPEGRKFYRAVASRGLLDDVFPVSARKPDGYWQDWENVKVELAPFIFGNVLASNTVIREKNEGLALALSKYHGGINVVRERLGCVAGKRSFGTLHTVDGLRASLDPLIDELGSFPTYTELRELDPGLCDAIYNHHGGIAVVRQLYGVDSQRHVYGYWKKWEHVEAAMQAEITRLERFPLHHELPGGLASAITKHHGGIFAVREKMGFTSMRRPPGYWKSLGNFEFELHPLIVELGRFPLPAEVQTYSSSLYRAMRKYPGGFTAVKTALGYDDEFSALEELVEVLAE